MPFKIEFTGETALDVFSQMRGFLADVQPDVPAATAKRGRKAAEPEAAKQIDLEEAIEAAPRKEAAPAEPPKAVSKDDLRRKLIELMHSKGEDAPTKLLQDNFSVSKIGELEPEQYARCVAAADKALTGD